MVDTGLMAATGGLATELQKQAVGAALAAGLTQEEAQKAGFGAVSALLREQLNASLQSGVKLDANTQALLDEAKKNGIEILADPAIESLDVQRKQLGVLERIAGGAGAVAGSGREARMVSAATGFAPRRLTEDTLILAHQNEMAMVLPNPDDLMMAIPSALKDRSRFVSARRGFFDDVDLPGADVGDAGLGGDEGATSPAPSIQTMMDALPGLLAQALASAPPPIEASLNVVANISEDPIQTQERREDMRRFTSRELAKEVRTGVGDFYSALYDTLIRARR